MRGQGELFSKSSPSVTLLSAVHDEGYHLFSEGGKLYGSVTAQEIADELFKQYGVKVEKRRIDVANIRNAGDFTVSVWLYAGITAEMTAKVEVG